MRAVLVVVVVVVVVVVIVGVGVRTRNFPSRANFSELPLPTYVSTYVST